MNSLSKQKCEPCEGGVEPLTREQFSVYLEQVKDWSIIDDSKMERNLEFKDFVRALDFVNRIGAIAEEEGHHPDISLYSWNKVTISLYTHAIGGLSINDFVVASKIDQLSHS